MSQVDQDDDFTNAEAQTVMMEGGGEHEDTGKFWKYDDKEANTNGSINEPLLKRLFTRQRHPMTSADLGNEKNIGEIEAIYEELHKQGKQYYDLIGWNKMNKLAMNIDDIKYDTDINLTAGDYDEFIQNYNKSQASKTFIDEMQFNLMFENMDKMDKSKFSKYIEIASFVDFLFYEGKTFIIVIGELKKDERIQGKNRQKHIVILEYDVLTGEIGEQHMSQPLYFGEQVDSENRLFLQRGKFVYFYQITRKKQDDQNEEQSIKLSKVNLEQIAHPMVVKEFTINKNMKKDLENKETTWLWDSSIQFKRLQCIIFEDSDHCSNRVQKNLKHCDKYENLNEDEWLENVIVMSQYLHQKGCGYNVTKAKQIELNKQPLFIITQEPDDSEDEENQDFVKQKAKRKFGYIYRKLGNQHENLSNDYLVVMISSKEMELYLYDDNETPARISENLTDQEKSILNDVSQNLKYFNSHIYKVSNEENKVTQLDFNQEYSHQFIESSKQKYKFHHTHEDSEQNIKECETQKQVSNSEAAKKQKQIAEPQIFHQAHIQMKEGQYFITLQISNDNEIILQSTNTLKKLSNRRQITLIQQDNQLIKNYNTIVQKIMPERLISNNDKSIKNKFAQAVVKGVRKKIIDPINKIGRQFVQVHPLFDNVFLCLKSNQIVYVDKKDNVSTTSKSLKKSDQQDICHQTRYLGSETIYNNNKDIQSYYHFKDNYPLLSKDNQNHLLIKIVKRNYTVYQFPVQIPKQHILDRINVIDLFDISELSLSSPVYFQNKNYFQNFQLIIDLGKAMLANTNEQKNNIKKTSWFIILEYRYQIDYELVDKVDKEMVMEKLDSKLKDGEDDSCTQLIGMKYLITPYCAYHDSSFNSLYEEENNQFILGTKIDFIDHNNKKFKCSFEMENFKQDDYQFRGPIASTGYKVYYEKSKQKALLVESKLRIETYKSKNSEVNFLDSELVEILQQQLMVVLNMVPKQDETHYFKEEPFKQDDFDVLQPLEILKCKSVLNFNLKLTNQLNRALESKYNTKGQSHQKSLIANICNNQPAIEHCLNAFGLTRCPFEISYDILGKSIIQDCLDIEDAQQSFKLLFTYLYDQNEHVQADYYHMLMEILPIILNKQNSTHTDVITYQRFLSNDLEDCRYSIALKLSSKNLPKFFHEEISMSSFDQTHHPKSYQCVYSKDSEFQADLREKQRKFIDEKTQNGTKQVDYSDMHKLFAIHQQIITENSEHHSSRPYEVDHYIIDFGIISKKAKMRHFLYGDKEQIEGFHKNFSSFEVADLIQKINFCYPDNIECQDFIRAIADKQFEDARILFQIRFAVFVVMQAIPFLAQILWFTNVEYQHICLYLCMIEMTLTTMFEYSQFLSDGLKNYFKELQAYLDVINITSFVVYVIFRFKYPHYEIPNIASNDKQIFNVGGSFFTVLTAICILNMVLKFNFFMKTYPQMGMFVELLTVTIRDVTHFSIYFVFLMVAIAVLYRVLGCNVSEGDWAGLNMSFRFLMYTFQNSIGNIATPDVSYWEDDNKHPLMESSIWVLWFINQFLMLIIMLNFLIAVISTSYEDVMSRQVIIEYKQRCKINREASQIYMLIKHLDQWNLFQREKLNIIMLTISKKFQNAESNQLNLVISSIKQNISSENESLNRQVDKLKNDIKEMKDGQSQLLQVCNQIKLSKN